MDLFTLLEDRTQGYLHLLKGSKVPLPKSVRFEGETWTADMLETPTGEPAKIIGDLDQSMHRMILDEISNVIDDEFKKYEEYFVQQVAKGYMPIDKILEDGERFNITLRLFQKLSRKAVWKGPKDIFGYDNWRTLETVTRKLAKEAQIPETGHGETDQDSILLFKKTYKDSRAELLASIYGDASDIPVEDKTYYLRKVLTPEGACKYGKGTQWCTNTKPPPKTISIDDLKVAAQSVRQQETGSKEGSELFALSRTDIIRQGLRAYGLYDLVLPNGKINPDGRGAYERLTPGLIPEIEAIISGRSDTMMNPRWGTSTAMQYIKHGLYIIELEDNKPRRPILQLSQDQIMNVRDINVTKAGPMLGDFIRSAMAVVKDPGMKHFKNLLK